MENRYGIARHRAERNAGFIDLIDTNFHSCGFHYPLEPIRRAVEARLSTDTFIYQPDPAGSPELRSEIAGFYADAGFSVDRDSIVVTASASESYSHIFASRGKPGDRVLLPRPGYPLFEEVAARHGLTVDFYHQRRKAGWIIDVDDLESLIEPRTAAVVLISPNNPTGSVVSPQEIRRIGDICRRHGLFLVVDEVFSELVFSSEPLARAGVLLPDLLVYSIHGVSKLFASPELKVSWIAVTGPDTGMGDTVSSAQAIEQLAVQNDLFLSASSLSQAIAAEMFREGPHFTREMHAEVSARRRLMLDGLRRIDGLTVIEPHGGIHLPVAIDSGALVRGRDDEDVAVELLERHGVATHPGYLYGIAHPVTLVVSFLATPERIREGLERIEDYLISSRR